MRRLRLLLVAGVCLVIGATVVPSAQALRFADSPCAEAGAGGVRICPDAIVGQPYSLKLTGEGGCGPALPYQYRLLSGVLPPGLSLSREGQLSGLPSSAGIWDFWLELSDEDPPSASWCSPARSEREFRIRVGARPATVGTSYSLALGVTGGSVRTWSLSSGVLPQGLDLDPVTGVVFGVPARAGTFPVGFSASDSKTGQVAIVDLTLVVYPRLVIATGRLAPARRGRSFHTRLRTQGAVGSVTFTVISGRLPVGVRLSTKRGVLQGTPRTAGTFRVTIQASDSLHRAATRSLSLTVRKPVLQP